MLNPADQNSSVFNFTLFYKDKQWDILPFSGTAPKKEDFTNFITRLKGV